jgi:hypothetical protein
MAADNTAAIQRQRTSRYSYLNRGIALTIPKGPHRATCAGRACRRGDRIAILFAAVHESASSPSRHLLRRKKFGRY